MYLECPVTFQENTCILIVCMYFTRTCIPNMKSKKNFGIHIRYIRIYVSCTWDTCGIHAGYMYLQRFEDTLRITLRIHAGYMRDT